MKNKTIAIVGATGAVGQEAIKVLENSKIEVRSLKLFASKKSKGKTVVFRGEEIVIQELTSGSFEDVDIAIFSIGSSLSKKFVPSAVKSGCIVIDNSSAFRMDEDVPLIIPEINIEEVKKHKGIIANPNCTSIIMLMAIYPIYRLSQITRLNFSSYQAVSGAGRNAINELNEQIKAYINNEKITSSVFKHQIAMNLFSHDSKILKNGYNTEEQKAINETKKILGNNNIKISPTCIRVPVMRSHSVAISIVTEKYLEFDDVIREINKFQGVKLLDNREENYFPMPIVSSGTYNVLIGRLRRGNTDKNEIMLFACGDQLLKGAALNAIQILEKIIKQ